MLASSWGDPVIGLDIHWEMVPTPAPTPLPIPNPFTGIVFDPSGLAIGLAITNAINVVMGAPVAGPVLFWGVPATNTGTEAKHVPGHILIPPGTAWAPVPRTPKPVVRPGETPKPPNPVKPDDNAVCVFGSKTVSVMGSNAVRFGDVLMSCSEPVRLPSSVVMAVPKGPPIMIGGPPSLDIMSAIFASLRTRFVSDSLHAALSRMQPSRFRNMLSKLVCFLTGHPVDVATGRVLTGAVDAEFPGPLPLRVERAYSSAFASRDGPLGHGWSWSLDQAVWEERGRVVLLAEDGRELEFDTFELPGHRAGADDVLWHPMERLTLHRRGPDRWELEAHDGTVREFARVPGRADGRAVVQRVRSRCGSHEVTFRYDRRGRLEWVRDAGGRLVNVEHDERGRVVALKLPAARGGGVYVHRRYDYDAEGDLVRVSDARRATWRYEYVTHLLTAETDRAGLGFYFAYDGLGEDAWCVRTWGDGGIYDHAIAYDKQNRVTFVTDSLGHTTSYAMNLAGLVTKVVDPLGAATRYEYDPVTFRETARESPHGARTEKRYDAAGDLAEFVAADGAATRFEYDGRHLLTRAVDARGGEWRWRYDEGGHLVERTLPTGERVRLTWRGGLLARAESAAGLRVSYEYDAQKNVAAVWTQDEGVARYRWDDLGRLVKVATPAGGELRFFYDAEGRRVETQTAAGVVEQLAYDAEGNVVEARNATRHARLGYAGFHRLAWREEGGARVAYEYDTEGRLVGVTNEAGERFGFARDANGRVVRETGFDGGVRSYRLDRAGRVVQVSMPSGRTSERAYDVAGRLVGVEHSDGTFARYAYDVGGLLGAAENQSARVQFERDAAGRVVAERSGGREVRSGYDLTGERSALATSLGARVTIGRDALGNAQDLFFGAADGRPRAADVRVRRDAAGAERSRRFANGIEVEWERDLAGAPTRRSTYLRRDLLADATFADATFAAPGAHSRAAGALDARTYDWRGEDQLAAVVDAVTGAQQYEHDARGRVTREWRGGAVTERAMDLPGNVYRTPDGRDRRYGAGNRLEAAGQARYEHDPDGNQVRRVDPDGGIWDFTWDGHGLLAEVRRPDGVRVEFAYDAFARRISKRTVGADGVTWRALEFVWDGHTLVHEVDRDRGLTTWYWEPETLTPVVKEQAGRRWAVATDHLGTPTEMYDDAGRLAWRMRLDVFGAATVDGGGAAADCPWRWPGQYADDDASLVYNRWRYYEPQRGTYISADPIGFGGGTNLYAYVDDPATEVDLFGLDATIDDNGFFAKSNEFARGRNPGTSRVRIPYQGTRGRDFTLADRLAGISEEWRQQHGYTWHHANYNGRTGYGDMQLVRTDVHGNTPHAGGVSDFSASTGVKYDTPEATLHVENEGRNRGRPCS